MFPSNYVEKVASPIPVASTTASEKPVYRPFGAAFHGLDKPPPAGQGVNSVGLQGQPEAQKASKYGDLKNTVRLQSRSKHRVLNVFRSRWPPRLLEVLALELVSFFGIIVTLRDFSSLRTGAAIGGGLVRALF